MPEPLTIARYAIFGPRAAVVPAHLTVGADWPIYNAPRPLSGTITWEQAGIGAGRFFAAIDPADPYAAAFTRRCAQDDAFFLVFATQEAAIPVMTGADLVLASWAWFSKPF